MWFKGVRKAWNKNWEQHHEDKAHGLDRLKRDARHKWRTSDRARRYEDLEAKGPRKGHLAKLEALRKHSRGKARSHHGRLKKLFAAS